MHKIHINAQAEECTEHRYILTPNSCAFADEYIQIRDTFTSKYIRFFSLSPNIMLIKEGPHFLK